MKKWILLFLFFYAFNLLFSQSEDGLYKQNKVKISKDIESKILSGRLIEKIIKAQKESTNSLNKGKAAYTRIILYFSEYPSPEQIKTLENLNVKCFMETWTPPVENHPYGFIVASVPVNRLMDVLTLQLIKKADTAERISTALNNTGTQSICAPLVWADGFAGKGVKIGILDSGIDISYSGTDLPSSFQFMDYSDYPNLDNDVANKVTGHGTHVTASALGRGILSEGEIHWNNGNGAFKGSAPEASLVFLKIGNDTTANASDASMIAAMDAAVNIYHVNVLSMSYGGWDDYHDGSSATEQKVDWVYSQGVPFFCSAGNSADNNKHYSGIINPFSESEYIEVIVSKAGIKDTKLRFNFVWFDGAKRNNLSIQLYDSTKKVLSNVTILPATESLRGTESQYIYSNDFLPSGNSRYYLRVVNNSASTQQFNIYEDWSNYENGTNYVSFSLADPFFTIGSPSSADNAFSVGAYVAKTGWTDYEDKSWWWGSKYIYNNIANFSSRGPTLDGRIKPDICAPGHVVISLRDENVYRTPNSFWIDNDGITGGAVNYYVMNGTSMACPIAAGAAALFLEKYPGILPEQIYASFKNLSNQSGLTNLPNYIWGYGKLDIYSAMKGVRDDILVDGNMNDGKYSTIAQFTSGRNGFGNIDKLGAIKFYSDGENLFIGVTGEASGDNNILLFIDFSGVHGRDSNTLGGGNSGTFVNSAFSYMINVKMDFDVDFALAFSGGNSTQYEFFMDAIKYGAVNRCAKIGKLNRMGSNSNYDIGSIFGGVGFMTMAYDSSFRLNQNKGVEFKIPISAFAGVDTSQTLRLFAVITSMTGNVSNVCIPGDPGSDNLGDGADFSAIPGQDFFTEPLKISNETVLGINSTNEVPKIYYLYQNYPNPFNPSTMISYQLPMNSKVTIKVFDVLGKEVATLVNEVQTPGIHHYTLSVVNYKLSSGVYFYRMKAGNFIASKKLILIK